MASLNSLGRGYEKRLYCKDGLNKTQSNPTNAVGDCSYSAYEGAAVVLLRIKASVQSTDFSRAVRYITEISGITRHCPTKVGTLNARSPGMSDKT